MSTTSMHILNDDISEELTTGISQASPHMPHFPPFFCHCRVNPPQYNSWSL
jgi:hypothetical protein